MRRTLVHTSVVLSSVLLLGCTLDGFMFAGTPHEGPYDFSDTTIPADRFETEGTFVTAADGTRIHLHFVRSSGDHPTRADTTVLYCHGNTDHIGHYWDRVELFYGMGYQVLIFDYRGYGRSDAVETTEAGVYLDAEAAFDHLLSLPEVNPDRVAFYGYSLGCAVCIEMATRYSAPPSALVVEAPFRSVQDLALDSSGVSLDVGMVADIRFDNIGKIDDIGLPLLVLHGAQDDYIMPEYGAQLFEAAAEPKDLWIVPGADHGTIPGDEGSDRRTQYLDRVTSFLDQHVP